MFGINFSFEQVLFLGIFALMVVIVVSTGIAIFSIRRTIFSGIDMGLTVPTSRHPIANLITKQTTATAYYYRWSRYQELLNKMGVDENSDYAKFQPYQLVDVAGAYALLGEWSKAEQVFGALKGYNDKMSQSVYGPPEFKSPKLLDAAINQHSSSLAAQFAQEYLSDRRRRLAVSALFMILAAIPIIAIGVVTIIVI